MLMLFLLQVIITKNCLYQKPEYPAKISMWFPLALIDRQVGKVHLHLFVEVEFFDCSARDFHLAPAGVKALEIDFLRLEVFGDQAEGVALDPRIDVLGDEDDALALLLEGMSAADDAVIGGVGRQAGAEFLVFFEDDAEPPAGLLELNALREFALLAQLVQVADNRAGVAAQVVGG